MCNLARHEKLQCFLTAHIIGEVDQSFIDGLRSRLSRDVAAQVYEDIPRASR